MESEAGTMLRGLLQIQNNLRQEGHWNKSRNIYPSRDSRGKRLINDYFRNRRKWTKMIEWTHHGVLRKISHFLFLFIFSPSTCLTLLLSRSGGKVVQVWWCTPIIWVLPKLWGSGVWGQPWLQKCVSKPSWTTQEHVSKHTNKHGQNRHNALGQKKNNKIKNVGRGGHCSQ